MKESLTKRIFDIFLSSSGLFYSAGLWVIIVILIWLEDGRPIFYLQERVGKGGRMFKTIQFRSMIKDAEKVVGPLQAYENDPRITKLGRILRAMAMDELPQLWNIFKGEMSFVGPRALRPVEIDSKDKRPRSVWEFKDFQERCTVRPGLTGVAQILIARDISRSEKFKYDIWYIKHQTFFLDLYLIFVSFLVTFRGRWEIRENKFSSLLRNFKKRVENDLSS